MGSKEKPYNSGTMTNAAFWSMIRSCLRNKSRHWKPIQECKLKARRKYTGPNKRRRWEYHCSNCNNYFPDGDVEIDHILPAGSLKCYSDLPGFVERLFCTVDNLRCVCKTCHLKITKDGKK